MESVTRETSLIMHSHKLLTKLEFVPMTRVVRGKPLVINPDADIYGVAREAKLFAQRLLTRAGDLAAMTAEHELLDVICHRLA